MNLSTEIEQKIRQLKTKLQEASYAYYVLDNPIMNEKAISLFKTMRKMAKTKENKYQKNNGFNCEQLADLMHDATQLESDEPEKVK